MQAAAGTELLALNDVEPERVPQWVNAANAVLVPSEREGFGLAVLEALACDVPVLATPVGVAPDVLAGVEGTLCAPFAVGTWRDGARAASRVRGSEGRGARPCRAAVHRSHGDQGARCLA